MFALTVHAQLVFDGAVTGLTYGLLAAGLVMIYRSSGILNFAYAEVGAFSAAFLALATIEWNWPFLLALPAALLIGALLSAVVELTVIRRLFDAPRVVVLIATVGVAELLLLFRLVLPDIEGFHRYPSAFEGRWAIGPLFVRSEQLIVLILVPCVIGTLAWFLTRTLTGTAIRGAAANATASRLMGVNVKLLSTLVWALAGGLSAAAAVVVRPMENSPVSVVAALDTRILVVALAAALVGRMRSLPAAVLAGVGIGITERVLLINWPDDPGLVTLVVLLVVLVMAMRSDQDEGRRASWSFASSRPPINPKIRALWWGRHIDHVAVLAAVAAGVLLPVIVELPSRQQLYSRVLITALVALSVTVLTGWAGQLSLGQFAFVGAGAFTTATVMREGGTFGAALIAALGIGVLLALVVGLPAVRVRGLLLAVTTLAFAVFASAWLLHLDLLDGGRPSIQIPRTIENGVDLADQRTYYWLCLAVLVVAALVLARLRRRGIGRMLIAVRENENAAAALTVDPTRMKLLAFALGGALGGLAGGLYGGLLTRLDVTAFPPEQSVRIVAVAVIGGLGSVTGAVLGAVWVIGLPALLGDTPEVGLATSGVGLLVLLMYFPGGLVHLLHRGRDCVLRLLARRVPEHAPADRPAGVTPTPRTRPVPETGIALEAQDVTVRFGGTVAVDGMSLQVLHGEIVGLIGSNGAGKTTFMNAVGGFVPCNGAVRLGQTNLSGRSAADRARHGLGRAFQNAELFPDLTVRETVQLALERRHQSSFAATLLALPGSARTEARQRADGAELIDFLGLGRYADAVVGNLSTGTRRIAELACLLALDASVLCLDEPTAGVAQKETEAFGPLLQEIRREFATSMLLIEHDMPMVLHVSDRVYCMELGRAIAEGSPEAVRNDPLVVASYLGTDERAIQRSGPV